MNGVMADLRFALRSLRRSPWYAAGVVVVLALGVGANAAMFTVLRSTLLRPLYFGHESQVVALEPTSRNGDVVGVSLDELDQWQRRAHTLTGLAGYSNEQVTLTGAGAQQEVDAVLASANLFRTLEVAPALGRTFTTDEQQPGRGHVVVLSDALWRNQFGADPNVLGSTIRLNDELYNVIGVMPRGFAFPVTAERSAQLWQPTSLLRHDATAAASGESDPVYDVVGRRAPGATDAQVSAELSAIQQAIVAQRANGNENPSMAVRVAGVQYRLTLDRKQRNALFALAGAVGLLWLIACADVASLLLARVTAKRREFAVRSSLGASRWRVTRMMLAEVALLTAGASILGVLLGEGLLLAFQRSLLRIFGPLHFSMDWAVLAGLSAASLLSAALLAAVPLWFSLRGPLESALRADGAQAGTGLQQGRLQRTLVVAELAMTLCLLVACGLLVRTVLALQQVPLGFRTDHVFSITPNLPFSRYAKQDPNLSVYQPLARRLRTLPGVEALAITSVTPLTRHFDVNFMLTVTPDDKPGQAKGSRLLEAKLRAAGPELQKVLGFRMIEGRFFDAGDTATSQPVMVVNRTFAREYAMTGLELSHFALGKGDRTFHVVGIIDDFHQQGIVEPAAPEIDLNGGQLQPGDGFYQPTMKAHAEILLRSERDAHSLIPELRRVLNETNPDLADAEIASMQQVVDDAMGSQLLATRLLEVLGGLALLVALTGLYSLMAYLVALRTREFGVRLALGAQRKDVVALVVQGAGRLLLAGTVAGLALSIAAAHLLSRFLYGVGSYDLRSFAFATTVLLMTGLVAAAVPARRVANVNPTEALRTE